MRSGCAITELSHAMPDNEQKTSPSAAPPEPGAVRKPSGAPLSLKVSEKGALSVYGLGRFPVTLYREQWERLLGLTDQIRQFIADHDAEFKRKA